VRLAAIYLPFFLGFFFMGGFEICCGIDMRLIILVSLTVLH
jgi:hypothetical protein